MLDNLRIFYNFLLFSDIDLGSNARSGRQGKSLDFDDYSDEDDEEEDETLETLRRLLSPSELSRLREKVFGGGDKEKQKGRRPRKRKKNKRRPKKEIVSRSSIGVEELKRYKGVRTIVKPGELKEILRTGTFDWNAKRIKRYEATDPKEEVVESDKEYEYEYEYEYEEYDDSEKILEGRAPNIKTVKNPTEEDKEENGEEQKSSSNRREQILTLVKQLRNMKSDD